MCPITILSRESEPRGIIELGVTVEGNPSSERKCGESHEYQARDEQATANTALGSVFTLTSTSNTVAASEQIRK